MIQPQIATNKEAFIVLSVETWLCFLHSQSDVFSIFQQLFKMVENQLNKHFKILW